jgi:adenylate cyclase
MKLLRSILVWVLAINLFIAFRFTGLDHLDWAEILTGSTIAAVIIGLLYHLSNIILERKTTARRSFLSLILLQIGVFILSIGISGIISLALISVIFAGATGAEIRSTLMILLQSGEAFVYTVFVLVVSLILYYNNQMVKKIGSQRLFKILIGKYHQPMMEEMIIMFLDLKSASAIAERLDSFKYSQFIQDFFFDLDKAITETGGVVHQYVGDEIVVVWDMKTGTEQNNCLRAFFLAEDIMKEETSKYHRKFGLVPEFKAGIHAGKVVVAEVGRSKQEIAFHGDTINTAARIRSECTHLKSRLLISSDLLSRLSYFDEDYNIESAGVFSLKGKQNAVGLISVTRK